MSVAELVGDFLKQYVAFCCHSQKVIAVSLYGVRSIQTQVPATKPCRP
jgi:hypothetical protein